jgi:hypothetical protein
MRRSTRQATKVAAKARSSGVIIPLSKSSSSLPQNKRIAFEDDDVFVDEMDQAGDDEDEEEEDFDDEKEEEDEDDDDDIEEVTGSDARQSIQRIRDEERKIVKESMLKKKRRKKEDVVADNFEYKISHSEDDEDKIDDEDEIDDEQEEEEEEEIEFTDDFFKAVDSERANQLHKAKKERKHNKILQKKMQGKHTTFIVEGDYDKLIGVPHKMEQNIEVVALGGGGDASGAEGEEEEGKSERQLVLSATLGSVPTKAAVLFARGGMMCGTAMERSSDSRKRKSKNDETWKRSKKMNRLGLGSRSGQAATLFVCKKKLN